MEASKQADPEEAKEQVAHVWDMFMHGFEAVF